jgi:hypothetical protein
MQLVQYLSAVLLLLCEGLLQVYQCFISFSVFKNVGKVFKKFSQLSGSV